MKTLYIIVLKLAITLANIRSSPNEIKMCTTFISNVSSDSGTKDSGAYGRQFLLFLPHSSQLLL